MVFASHSRVCRRCCKLVINCVCSAMIFEAVLAHGDPHTELRAPKWPTPDRQEVFISTATANGSVSISEFDDMVNGYRGKLPGEG